jgi:transcriptional regulator with XRE-family HTH domain
MGKVPQTEQTPLAVFVRGRLEELGMKQSEFCRQTGFDQGALSKILSSMVTNLSLESALRLSVGLRVSPKQILSLVHRMDLYKMILDAYSQEFSDLKAAQGEDWPEPVREVSRLALEAYKTGHSLEPALALLYRILMGQPHGPAAYSG